MKILAGKRQIVNDIKVFTQRLQGYSSVHIDVGTGSGRLMLKRAIQDPNGFYIGMDPCAENMRVSSVKAVKQSKETEHMNLLFVVGAIETAPEELAGIADYVSVILPWGSLRDGIVKADYLILNSLRKLGKAGAELEALVGYDMKNEPIEMEKRLLPMLSVEHFHAVNPLYRNAGIDIRSVHTVGNAELRTLESDWAKKLAYGNERVMYQLHCIFI